jgi:CubicO group peptidase (beta-lactamase class C family)
MKPFKLIGLLALMALLPSCHVVRFFVWNFADIHDYKKFAKMPIRKGGEPFIFTAAGTGAAAIKLPKTISLRGKPYTFDGLLERTKTVAFLVVRNDSLLYQQYLSGYSNESVVPSFSMAKSFTSILMGIAIDEGAIKSVSEPITNYLPELTKPGFEKITIEHLLDMQSGIRYNEGYVNPFGDVAKYYYGTNLKKYIKHLKIKGAPGKNFDYISVNTQLLGLIIERATHKPLADYMEEKVWKYIGAEYDASWSVDSRRNKEAKAFCCFNAHAADFAKFGRLYLNKGMWNGRRIVSEAWVNKSLSTAGNKNGGEYSYQWWHNASAPGKDFLAEGLLGQFVYVYPEKHIIIVRLGKKEVIDAWPQLMKGIAEAN